MAVLFSVALYKLAVAAGSGQRFPAQRHHSLQRPVGGFALKRFVDTNTPGFTPLALPGGSQLAANFHQIMAQPLARQKTSQYIHRVSLRDGVYVDLDARIGFEQGAVFKADFLIPDAQAQAIDLCRVGRRQAFFVTKSPGAHQGPNGNVESAARSLRDFLRAANHSGKMLVGLHSRLIPVNPADDGITVPQRHAMVDQTKNAVDRHRKVATHAIQIHDPERGALRLAFQVGVFRLFSLASEAPQQEADRIDWIFHVAFFLK